MRKGLLVSVAAACLLFLQFSNLNGQTVPPAKPSQNGVGDTLDNPLSLAKLSPALKQEGD